MTFLLRSPATFDDDQSIQKHVKSGKARLIKGDGLVLADVKNVWAAASLDRPVDVPLFTVGFSEHHNNSVPFFHIYLLIPIPFNSRWIPWFPSNHRRCHIPTQPRHPMSPKRSRRNAKNNPLPKVIVLSAIGVTPSSRSQAPFLLNTLYSYMISLPLQDKLGVERVISHCAGWNWNWKDGDPKEDLIGKGCQEREGLPAPGHLKDAMILRPAMLNNGGCIADSGKDGRPYRAAEGNIKGRT